MSGPISIADANRRRLLPGALRTAKLEHAGVVSGISVLLSAIIVLIYIIPVTLVHMQAFIVTKISPETRINASWFHNGRRSLSQRSIPINTTLSVVTALYTRVYMEPACSNGPESLFVRKDFNVAAQLLADLLCRRRAGFCRKNRAQTEIYIRREANK